jgi:hypothetical protein
VELRVFAFIAGRQQYPDTLGHGKQFEALIHQWRAVRAGEEPL